MGGSNRRSGRCEPRDALGLGCGDVIRFLGVDHVFTHYETPEDPEALERFWDLCGHGAAVAVCSDGWRITACVGQRFDVVTLG